MNPNTQGGWGLDCNYNNLWKTLQNVQNEPPNLTPSPRVSRWDTGLGAECDRPCWGGCAPVNSLQCWSGQEWCAAHDGCSNQLNKQQSGGSLNHFHSTSGQNLFSSSCYLTNWYLTLTFQHFDITGTLRQIRNCRSHTVQVCPFRSSRLKWFKVFQCHKCNQLNPLTFKQLLTLIFLRRMRSICSYTVHC